jgi:cytoskeletal protein RodZ
MTDDSTTSSPTNAPGGRSWRVPLLAGALVLVIVVVVALVVGNGDDEGDNDAASSDPTASTPATESPSASDSPSATDPTESASPTPSTTGDPTLSPIITKAVKAAMADDFPALVPSGVPSGWTVTSAAYQPKRGGTWRIDLTDPTGAAVVLVQATGSVEDVVHGNLGMDTQQTGKVNLSDYGTGTWTVWQNSSSYGIAKLVSSTGALVYGPGQDTVVTLAQELLTAEDADLPEAG